MVSVSLVLLPQEILFHVLSYVEPKDLAALSETCRHLYSSVSGNNALCKAIYLRHLDSPPSNDLSWEQELHDLVKLQRICASYSSDKSSELPFVHATTTRLLANSIRAGTKTRPTSSTLHPASRNASLLGGLFSADRNRDAFLCRSFLFERARGLVTRFQDPPRPEHQMSAHLHALYGMSVLRAGRTRSGRLYPFACSKVYDLRQYTALTRWGPFMNDGSDRVDWEKVEAVLLVLRNNIRSKGLDGFPIFANFWDRPFAGSWPGSYLAMPRTGLAATAAAAASSSDKGKEWDDVGRLDAEDPYGVSGTWLRVVCFLDYNDFFSYNFPIADPLPDTVPRPSLDIGEATRLILMKIHVTRIEPPGENDGQELPVVYFKGFSRSLDAAWDENANSDLRGEINIHGLVRLTKEGEVRWTTFSIFSGQERWRSESVQIGGVRSARGVIGNWFDKDFDPHGPCGPTAFWKISDRDHKTADSHVLYHDFLPLLDEEDLGGADDDDDGDYEGDGNGDDGDEVEMEIEPEDLEYFLGTSDTD